MTPRKHTHVWVHVNSGNRIVCKCVCGRVLSPSQILTMQEVAA